MKSEERILLEKQIIELIEQKIVKSQCDECSKDGIVVEDPYSSEINELLVVKALCPECLTSSIDDI